MSKYLIDYEYGRAILYTPKENWKRRFVELASQCFGIRKSIGKINLIEKTNETAKCKLFGEYERLEHDGDTIIWDKNENKIKSEWDKI